jgi:diguanylate cyclase (GGDEF)-like protein
MRTKAASARPVVVLIVSKQEWTSRSLESILAPRGYAVHKTYTSAQAVKQAQIEPPDAIIVDEELPDGTGVALCELLRARGLVTPSTPVLLSVARPPTRRDRLAALNARAWACLGDPIDSDELLALLATFVPAKLDAEQARTDGLVDEVTGVYNVRGLTRRAHELAAAASRRHAALACVLIAPDPADEAETAALQEGVVRRIGAALRSAARQSDAIGRLGPGAFAVVAVDTDAMQARHLAERLAAAILAESDRQPEALPRFRLRAGLHGVSDFRTASIDTVELMLRATSALERARANPAGAWLQEFEAGDSVSLS